MPLIGELLNCTEHDAQIVFAAPKPTLRVRRESSGRRSRYRGVTKNGGSWQVLMTIREKKKYFGSCSTEEEAGRLFDKYAILLRGLSVR